MSNYKIPREDSFSSPTPKMRPKGLASRSKAEEPEQGPLERFFNLFRSAGGELKQKDNTSSSTRAMKFYDASNNKPTRPNGKDPSARPMRIGKARAELEGSTEIEQENIISSNSAATVLPSMVTITSGDTLSAIARDNNTTVAEIQKANPTITDPNRINVGQDINIPSVAKQQDTSTLKGNEVGLMAKPVQSIVFSTPVTNTYTNFLDIEGDESHLGGADYKEVGITLPLGIVPSSGLKYTHNGTTINLPDDITQRWTTLKNAGVTLNNFNPASVDTSAVVKDGIKRTDYNSDEDFTKAVVKSFETSVIKEITDEGVDSTKVNDSVMEGLISLAWNVQGHKWKDIEPAYKEIVKTTPDMAKVQTGMLQVFTSGGIVVRGLAERRAKDYNKVAAGLNQPTIESYTPVKLKNGNAGFEYSMSDGTTVTRDTGKDYATKASQGSFKNHLDKEIDI
jgi:LysM repeat protein